MQLYVHDPLEDDIFAFEPSNNFRVDFGFWTGANLVAVEIDGTNRQVMPVTLGGTDYSAEPMLMWFTY